MTAFHETLRMSGETEQNAASAKMQKDGRGEYARGWDAAIEQCASIAERWRDENKAARVRAVKSGRRRFDLLGDETQLVMAEQLEGAAIECNAIAQEIRRLLIAATLPSPVKEAE